ncbi:growth inhibitor PemK [Peteryoungia ipomoeae]|uniref:Growth inhibitor PemK n=1 Tax=Peteryoungia ipomoeae TaxID=1210932 RepID=A0A4S8P387_9HYPH|nr:growth inhibitor PemK [Peteryoungia ipomoeae]THV23841.1 growth inhibitor PemK [Peteryoungia ipomoeae]
MKIPAEPPIGHVVAYEYLWSSKAGRRQDGEKTYPTALLLAKKDEFGSTIVYALGISHMKPQAGRRALQVPEKLCRHIGLDDRPQWIYTDELNLFVWPRPDLRPAQWISRKRLVEDTCVLGALPRDWFDLVKQHFAESYRLRQLAPTKRTE